MKNPLIIALAAILVITGSSFAYTFTTASGSIGIMEPTGDVATCNATATQPGWDSILTDLASENKTSGEVPTGNLFTINPNSAYGGDVVAKVYLANTSNLTKAYSYLNMKLYLDGSVEAGETPNYRLLTLQNGEAAITMDELEPVLSTWTQTSKTDFDGGTLNQVETTTNPGDVKLDILNDSVTDTFNDSTKITSANVTVSGGQVKLDSTAGTPATETLRPTADGDETTVEAVIPTTPTTHWDKVDDITSDDDSTYVYTQNFVYPNWTEDLYQIADHSTGQGQINYVRVYAVARSSVDPGGADPTFRIHIKTNGVEYNGTELQTTTSYVTYSYDWNTNPQTGQAWTWTEIDSLQAGVSLLRPKNNQDTRCTQVYVEVNYTSISYETSGTVTSINLLSGETVLSIDSFDYNASAIPSGTALKVQFSQDNSNWYNSAGTLDGWDTLVAGTHSIDLSGLSWLGSNFYYHILFTSDGSDTPVLDEITVNFSVYYTSGDLTSSSYDTGYNLDWDWGIISFTVSEPSSTDIKFQIRTAATEGGLSSATWYGPTGTSDYYQTSSTAVNSIHDGDRWIQYKAYFSGPGTSTPTFSDIGITYSAQTVVFTIEVTGGSYSLVSDNTSEWDTGWTVTPEFFCEVTPR
ncbi:hypothetical protein ACFLWW_00175 [Chloroflexota bacterium]